MSLKSLQDNMKDKLLLVSSYQAVFKGEDGDRVLRHLMKEAGILKPTITTDTNMLLVRNGQQHIVLSILKILGKDPREMIEQIKESLNET